MKRYFVLIAILMLALFLRVYGVNFGYPYGLNFDEMQDIPKALRMFQTGDWNPQVFIHGTFYYSFYAVVAGVYYFIGKVVGLHDSINEISIPTFFVFARIISAVIGTVAVYITYLIGKRLFSRNAALIASGVLSVTFLHVHISHYATQDSLLTLLVAIAFLFAVRAYQKGNDREYVLSGIFAGMAWATSFTGLLSIFPLLLVCIYRCKQGEFRKTIYGLLFFLTTFLFCSPFTLLDFSSYYKNLVFTLSFHHTGQGAEWASYLNGIPTWLWWFKYFLSTGLLLPFFVTSIVGLACLFRRFSKESSLLLIYPLTWSVEFLRHAVRYERHAASLMPFLAILSAIGIYGILGHIRRRYEFGKLTTKIFMLMIFIGIFLYPTLYATIFDYTISQKDTSIEAAEWLENNVKGGSRIAVFTSVPEEDFSSPFRRLEKKYKLLVTNTTDHNFVTDPNLYASERIDYIVLGSDAYNLSLNYKSVYGADKYSFFTFVRKNLELVKKVSSPLFERGFFSPHALELSSTVNFIHNRTYEFYKVPPFGMGKQYDIYKEEIKKTYGAISLSRFSVLPLADDDMSSTGKALFADKNKTRSGFVVAGPYEEFPVGDYEAVFYLKTDSCDNDKVIAYVSAQLGGGGEVYVRRPIKGKDFNKCGRYQKFKLGFHNPVQYSWTPQIELPIEFTGAANIWIEKIELKGKSISL